MTNYTRERAKKSFPHVLHWVMYYIGIFNFYYEPEYHRWTNSLRVWNPLTHLYVWITLPVVVALNGLKEIKNIWKELIELWYEGIEKKEYTYWKCKNK